MEVVVFLALSVFVAVLVGALRVFTSSPLPRGRGIAVAGEPEWRSNDIINAARIKVAGVGGLGLVAMALAVAIALPGVGVAVGVGAILGGLFAAILIARQNRTGPMPSSGRKRGANTILSIDTQGSEKL